MAEPAVFDPERYHRLRRVATGHGVSMSAGDDRLSTSVSVVMYPEGLDDDAAIRCAMSAGQATLLAHALLGSAIAAEADLP